GDDQSGRGVAMEGMATAAISASQSMQKRVDDLEAQMAADRALGYTDKHPDIQRLQREIKQARADLVANKHEATSAREETLKTDPLYRAKVQERDMAKLHIKELQNA